MREGGRRQDKLSCAGSGFQFSLLKEELFELSGNKSALRHNTSPAIRTEMIKGLSGPFN